MISDFRLCWGKAQPVAGAASSWHPIVYHSLDVAAVADVLLSVRPLAARRAAQLLQLSESDARRLIVALVALHDLGKFAPAFQKKSPEHWPTRLYGPLDESWIVDAPHTEDGFVLWADALSTRATERLWPGAGQVLHVLASAVFGHHGRPAGARARTVVARFQLPESRDAALQCADAMLALLIPDAIRSAPPGLESARRASWWFAGLVTAADWLGSSQRWFPYRAPGDGTESLGIYWEIARAQAEVAVRDAGILPPRPARAKTFGELTGTDYVPTPTQRWADTVDIPPGPTLFLIEDVTGAGKTEAAQILVHRLMTRGCVHGAYWGMPTQATANAMYGRQAVAVQHLFDDAERRPSLVLSHGQQRLHTTFRATVLDGAVGTQGAVEDRGDPDEDTLPSTAACSAWLADDRRAAMLADVGAGTIDQAFLGILPSKFNTLRLFGLADKVLIVDEAHAYDRYMGEELDELLRFHAALGGSAIVLSATLPLERRRSIARAWNDGVRGGGRRLQHDTPVRCEAYPLGTVVAAGQVGEHPLASGDLCARSVPVRLVHHADDAVAHVVSVAARGGSVAWIRNTVDDCIAAAALLRGQHALEPIVFHARFAQCDRQQRESEVLSLFGKDSTPNMRNGRVVVATQVIEQSLDLDFDAMVSDVAPIDLLIQRAGRLWRHGRGQRAVPCEFVLLAPRPDEHPPEDWLRADFTGTSYVYKRVGLLWRTVRVLDRVRVIDSPGNLRNLIESVYGDAAEDIPDALMKEEIRAQGEESGQAAIATFSCLKVNDGYDATAHAWVSEIRARTRLSDDQTTVRLARVREDGALEPWATDARHALESWKAWALSEVRLSARRVPFDAVADAQYSAMVDDVRAQWGRFEREIPVLPLGRDGQTWRGSLFRVKQPRPIPMSYSIDAGLVYEPTRT